MKTKTNGKATRRDPATSAVAWAARLRACIQAMEEEVAEVLRIDGDSEVWHHIDRDAVATVRQTLDMAYDDSAHLVTTQDAFTERLLPDLAAVMRPAKRTPR